MMNSSGKENNGPVSKIGFTWVDHLVASTFTAVCALSWLTAIVALMFMRTQSDGREIIVRGSLQRTTASEVRTALDGLGSVDEIVVFDANGCGWAYVRMATRAGADAVLGRYERPPAPDRPLTAFRVPEWAGARP